MKAKITNKLTTATKKKIAEAGWDLPPLSPSNNLHMLELAQAFEQLDEVVYGINSTQGYRRHTLGKRPKSNDPAIDPPVSITTIWDVAKTESALMEHYLGTFTNSAYLCEAMIGDARIGHAIASRTKGVTKRKHFFTPNPRAKDKKLAKYISDQYQEIYLDILPLDVQEQLWMWTPMMGFDLFNMVWEPGQEDMYLPTLRHWHPSFTFYLMAGVLEERTLQAITMGGGSTDTSIVPIHIGDPEWFHFAPFGEYRGWIRGAIRQTAIPWIVRNFSLRDWSRLGEVHGLPQRVVKVPANALEEDKARIYNKVIHLASEAVFVMPVADDGTGFDISLLEAKNADSYKILEQLGHRCDSDIMLAIKGTQLISAQGDQKGGDGSKAAAKVGREEDGDYSDADATKFANAVRSQIFTHITNYNYEDAEDCIPMLAITDEPPEDNALKSTVYLNMSEALVNYQKVGVDVEAMLPDLEEEFNIKFNTTKLNPIETAPSEFAIRQRLETMNLRKTMQLQTILIEKAEYTLEEAKAWLEKHGYKTDVDEKEDTYRFRQRDPGDFVDGSFRTVKITEGIKFVLGKIKPDESQDEESDGHTRTHGRKIHAEHQAYVDSVIEKSIAHGTNAITPLVKKIQSAIDESDTPAELRAALKKIAHGIKSGSMEEIIKNSRLMSELAGRAAQK